MEAMIAVGLCASNGFQQRYSEGEKKSANVFVLLHFVLRNCCSGSTGQVGVSVVAVKEAAPVEDPWSVFVTLQSRLVQYSRLSATLVNSRHCRMESKGDPLVCCR
jgi:hypothetical protein